MTDVPATPVSLPLLRRPIHPARAWVLGVLAWLALWPFVNPLRHSGNVWSRYMTIESLVERGTTAIERSPLLIPSGSPDVVKIGPHVYSAKPPVLPALATLLYAPLYVSGQRFSGPPPQLFRVNWVLVVGVVGLSTAATTAATRLLLQLVDVSAWCADLLALSLTFGTQLFSYAVTFNNHSVAAGLITWAFALVALEREESRVRRGLAGLCAGLAATIDLPPAARHCWRWPCG